MTATIEKTQVIDKQALKAAILELIVEDKDFALQISKLVDENSNNLGEGKIKTERLERLNKTIDKHFEEYDKVFKALA